MVALAVSKAPEYGVMVYPNAEKQTPLPIGVFARFCYFILYLAVTFQAGRNV
jgi:hypothetical protein